MRTPWKTVQPIDAERDYVVVATELVPRSLRTTGPLFRGARAASAQIATAPGIVGFATSAKPFARRYETISLWENEAAVDAFSRSGVHHQLVRDLAPALASTNSCRARRSGAAGRPTWSEARTLLTASPIPT